MLVLSRTLRETVIITVPPCATTQTIKVQVVELFRSKVRIGFAADPRIAVHRGEIQTKIDAGEAI